MKLKSIKINNYRCFKELNVDLDENLNVIVGINGAGKTSILEAMTVALGTYFVRMDIPVSMNIKRKDVRLEAYEIGETDDVQPQYPVGISATADFDGKEIEWMRTLNSENGKTTLVDAKDMTELSLDIQSRLRNGDADLVLPMFAYYGTGRLWDYHKEKRSDAFKASNRANGYIDCLDGTANIKLMINWFQKKTIQSAQKNGNGLNSYLQLPVVYHAMAKCYANVSHHTDVRVQYNLDTNEIDFYYKDNDGKEMHIPLSQLSDGYKSTISLIADIAYRMAVLNPQLGTATLEKTEGVVLIDEVDLHLHPAWQHSILSDLRDIFPAIQFIVTTHAPAVISSAKSDNLLLLSDYDVIGVSSEIFGNDVNSILTDIMDAKERNPIVADMFLKYYDHLNAGKYDDAESVLDEIDAERGGHDKTVAGERVKLKLERIRGGKNG